MSQVWTLTQFLCFLILLGKIREWLESGFFSTFSKKNPKYALVHEVVAEVVTSDLIEFANAYYIRVEMRTQPSAAFLISSLTH